MHPGILPLLQGIFLLFLNFPALGHDWYTGLTASDGAACCSNKDCHPVRYRHTDVGSLEIEISAGYWISVSPDAVLPALSPDTSAHACYWFGSLRTGEHHQTIGPVVRCVVLPGNS